MQKKPKSPVDQVDTSVTRENARVQLLRAIKRYRPDVLSSLARDVLPGYKQEYRPGEKQSFLMHWWQLRDLNDRQGNRTLAARGGRNVPLFRLERRLWSWADTYNLKEDWFLDYALQTLSRWCEACEADGDWAYELQGPRYVALDVSSKFTFEYDPWDPKGDTWRSFDVKLTEAFLRHKQTYHSAMTVSWEADKKNFAREKREDRHFKWIIDYQIPLKGKQNRSQRLRAMPYEILDSISVRFKRH